ncbi:hypothetical protein, partial [Cellulomonas sp. RIT-PI-Y]|uniref:hypothetical protein n=1 Tax=Cellulomonas sp. RIT-PI-Y TaxID=3035297 RepID=UPI0021D9C5C9
SGTWRTGSWGWASNTDVLQGGSPYVAQDHRGGWWHGDAPRAVAGRTITGARVRLGSRLRVGDYNTPLTVHLHLLANKERPPADFTRTSGPHDITLAPNQGAGWWTIPTSWGQLLADNGGGVGIQGTGYGGVAGVGADPESGQVALDWTR